MIDRHSLLNIIIDLELTYENDPKELQAILQGMVIAFELANEKEAHDQVILKRNLHYGR